MADDDDVEIDRNGMEVISGEECLLLLQSASEGRVAVSIGALPAVFPVNLVVWDDDIVFRTGSGTKLEAAVKNSVVAFEVDAVDPIAHTGWNVSTAELFRGGGSIRCGL